MQFATSIQYKHALQRKRYDSLKVFKMLSFFHVLLVAAMLSAWYYTGMCVLKSCLDSRLLEDARHVPSDLAVKPLIGYARHPAKLMCVNRCM